MLQPLGKTITASHPTPTLKEKKLTPILNVERRFFATSEDNTPFSDASKAVSPIPALVAKTARDTDYNENIALNAVVNSNTGTVTITCDQFMKAGSLNVYFSAMTNTIHQAFGLQSKLFSAFRLAPISIDVALDKVPLGTIIANDPKHLCIKMQNVISLSYGVSITIVRFLVPDRETHLFNPDSTTRLRGTIIVLILYNKIEKLDTSISIFSAKVKVCKLW